MFGCSGELRLETRLKAVLRRRHLAKVYRPYILGGVPTSNEWQVS